MRLLIKVLALFQQKADFGFDFVPHFELAPKVAKSGVVVDAALCKSFNDRGPTLTDHLQHFVDNVKTVHDVILLRAEGFSPCVVDLHFLDSLIGVFRTPRNVGKDSAASLSGNGLGHATAQE
jgi:hypothetical protein